MDVSELLASLRELLDSMVRQSEALRSVKYYAASGLIRDIEQLESQRCKPGSYGREKLVTFQYHLAAIAKLSEDDGHSLDEHHVWAISALESLRHILGVE